MKELDLILFTHNDMDGYGCKLVLDITMKDSKCNYSTVICHNGGVDSAFNERYFNVGDITPNTIVVFTDICPTSAFLEGVILPLRSEHKIKDVYVFDHHESNSFAIDLLGDHADMYIEEPFSDMESGTSLFYKACWTYITSNTNSVWLTADHPINVELYAEVVDLIRLYDTYQWKQMNNTNAKKLSILFSMIGGENFVKKYYNRIIDHENQNPLFTETELEFINCKYDYSNQIVNQVTPNDFETISVNGYKLALLMKGMGANINEISDRFLEEYPEYDAIVQFSTFSQWQFGFRSKKDDINSAQLFAVPLGGGGHPKASGAPVPKFIKEAIKDAIVRHLNGNNLSITISTIYEEDDK